MAYKAPIWEDGKSPAISAENLNNLSQAAEGAQVLYGNSAPTSSTEGAVGQFYLVVVADSDGNYPLYQCVAIANGSYTWRDTRRIPDSITSMLGIPAPGTINRALNVLANVGNLHVWERVQSGVTDYLTSTDRNAYPDESTDGSDAYYTLGAAGYLNFYYSENDGAVTWKYSSSISVDADGTVSLVSPSRTEMMADNTGVSSANNLKGKFVLLSAKSNYTDATHGVIYYIPADATISYQVSSTTPWYIQTNKAQPVHGHAAIPANTTITYLGQLGGGARIEVGSYVGTGTYGSSNPNSLYVGTNCVKVEIRAIYSSNRIGSPFLELHPKAATETWRDHAYFRNGSLDSNSRMRIVDGVLYWHSNGAEAQGNENGVQHTYSIFKK